MASFVDDSDNTLVRKIKKVQSIPEPTAATYYNPIPPNLYRNPRVQEEQVPLSQVYDKDTEYGVAEALRQSQISQAEKTKIRMKKEEEEAKNSWWNKFFQLAPTRGTVQLATAIATGNPVQVAAAIAQLGNEHIKEKRIKRKKKATEAASELAEAKRLLAELKEKRAKTQTTQTTGHKGQKK